jgi:hypothetical protein
MATHHGNPSINICSEVADLLTLCRGLADSLAHGCLLPPLYAAIYTCLHIRLGAEQLFFVLSSSAGA